MTLSTVADNTLSAAFFLGGNTVYDSAFAEMNIDGTVHIKNAQIAQGKLRVFFEVVVWVQHTTC